MCACVCEDWHREIHNYRKNIQKQASDCRAEREMSGTKKKQKQKDSGSQKRPVPICQNVICRKKSVVKSKNIKGYLEEHLCFESQSNSAPNWWPQKQQE